MRRLRMRKPFHLNPIDVFEANVSSDPEGRFDRDAAPDVTLRVGLDMSDPLLERVLPPYRVSLIPERSRRGDRCSVAFVGDEVAGWLMSARVSHRDPWSGLRVHLGPDEIYSYDMWVEPPYRRTGLGIHLLLADAREAVRDPTINWFYGIVDARNEPMQRLVRGLGFEQVQSVKYARILKRWALQVPFSDRPRYGPFSGRGRHRPSRFKRGSA
jgi:ribosomal protein S18 acetylase RimI-like enzyme